MKPKLPPKPRTGKRAKASDDVAESPEKEPVFTKKQSVRDEVEKIDADIRRNQTQLAKIEKKRARKKPYEKAVREGVRSRLQQLEELYKSSQELLKQKDEQLKELRQIKAQLDKLENDVKEKDETIRKLEQAKGVTEENIEIIDKLQKSVNNELQSNIAALKKIVADIDEQTNAFSDLLPEDKQKETLLTYFKALLSDLKEADGDRYSLYAPNDQNGKKILGKLKQQDVKTITTALNLLETQMIETDVTSDDSFEVIEQQLKTLMNL